VIAETLAAAAGGLGPLDLLALSSASALGAACRYAVDRLVTALPQRAVRDGRTDRAPFPAGIVVVNLTGCLLVGLLAGWASQGGAATWLAVAQVGFVASYTTFSTWALDSLLLLQERRGAALLNLIGSLVGGLCAVFLGYLVTAG